MTVLGIWIATALTLCIYSFLYKDNPFFKFAEHLFVGVSAGYLLAITYHTNFLPYIYYPLRAAATERKYSELIVIIPSLMGILMFSKFIPKFGWMVRLPFAFLMGYSAGVSIPVTMQTDIFQQIYGTAEPFSKLDDIWTILNSIAITAGVICTLMYFFFSREQKGVVGGISELGTFFLMIAFGASFGYTVMARISLLIGRIDFLLSLPSLLKGM